MKLSRVVALAFFVPVGAAAACGGSASHTTPEDAGGGGDSSTAGDSGPSEGSTGGDSGSGSDTGAARDAAPDVDNGAPSKNYPAPHPPLPTLTNASHGPVLTTPKVVYVFYPGDPYEAGLKTFAQKVATSTYWPAVTQQYGVSPITYGATYELTGQTPPGTIKSSDVQTFMGQEIQSGALGTPDPETIYTIVYPAGTTITQPNPVSPLLGTVSSCSAFGGYHDNVAVSLTDGGTPVNFAYAVIPTCTASLDDLTAVISHEWVEASTDPLPTSTGAFQLTPGPSSAFFTVDGDHVVWAVLGGGEAGDLCEPEGQGIYFAPTDVGNLVQRTWSNLSAAASHDPCVPAQTGAFFDSAPVLDETVTFTSSLTGSITTKGVTIPVGSSKTIEVDLFSDGDPGGPWTVTADDVLAKYYGNYGITPSMSFAWDRTSGLNGEKLHLTITVTQASPVGNGHAFMITSTQGSRVAVWPGLVVDK